MRIADLPGVRLVIVGDGPDRPALERMLPGAHFAGFLGGDDLAARDGELRRVRAPGRERDVLPDDPGGDGERRSRGRHGRGRPPRPRALERDGWLYRPGDLAELRSRVLDLTGDDAKRRAFSVRAREAVAGRGWDRLGDELIEHYEEVAEAQRATRGERIGWVRRSRDARSRSMTIERAADVPTSGPIAPPRWRRYVAVGDSLTEGLCDTSRMPEGEYRGWADRLAMLLALTSPAAEQVGYANLAVRSRRVDDAVTTQMPQAVELGADLVTVLIGANDLVGRRAEPDALARRLETAVRRPAGDGLRRAARDAVPAAPTRHAALRRRFARFNARLRVLADATGSMLLDVDAMPELVGHDRWAEDRVHLNSAGHRGLAYAAARVLGVPDAQELGALERAVHAVEQIDEVTEDRTVGDLEWLRRHAAPWIMRRVRGRAAGDGRVAKRPALLPVVVAAEPVPKPAPVRRARRAGRPPAERGQPLLRRNSRLWSTGPCVFCAAPLPSRCDSPSRCFEALFLRSSASRNLRFVSSDGPVVCSSSDVMGSSLARMPRPRGRAGRRAAASRTGHPLFTGRKCGLC